MYITRGRRGDDKDGTLRGALLEECAHKEEVFWMRLVLIAFKSTVLSDSSIVGKVIRLLYVASKSKITPFVHPKPA
jgi:hypothetical protein